MAYQWRGGWVTTYLQVLGRSSKWLGGKEFLSNETTELVRAKKPEATTWTMRIVGLLLTWFAV